MGELTFSAHPPQDDPEQSPRRPDHTTAHQLNSGAAGEHSFGMVHPLR